MFFSIEVGDIFISSKSTSARTGLAPASNTALAVATKVRSGIIISSFFFKLSEFNAKCRAAVPLETPIAYFAPVNFEKSFSNWRNFGPSVSNDEFKAFITTVLSRLVILGTKNGTLTEKSSNASFGFNVDWKLFDY